MVINAKLRPVWRLEPNHGGTTMVAGVDPSNVEYMLTNGWTFDGAFYRCELEDDGEIEMDGRVSIRMRQVAL